MTTPPTKIVQVFSDRSGAELIAGVCERWRGELSPGKCLQTEWNTELFRSPKLRLMAAREAAEANVIVIAAKEGNPLSPEITEWLALWRNRGRVRRAFLVAFLIRESLATPPIVERRLRHFAIAAGMDFLCHSRLASLTRARWEKQFLLH